ncbi:Universal stress protein A-like protein [Morus notabilis]|uniref:Universal stress protein A-like protein n=1 Tax=Morus notabilis TaxID=981085 RepID=W9SEW6_9ROSA|nr:universal stress protein A-like protein [Morus notabilis]EXC03813.1 Universal stress protein A-like protein [Morus notabilis]
MDGSDQSKMMVMKKRKPMRVMVAMDESDFSFHALKWALDHVFVTPEPAAEKTEEASPEEVDMVVLVHVQEPFVHYGFPAGPGGTAVYATTTVVESVRKAQEENSAALLSRALQMCKEKPNIKAETLMLEGDPKDRICQATEQMHVDLLVVGSRGLGTIKRAFLGSVSDYCTHHAKCPVLIVKPPKETAK